MNNMRAFIFLLVVLFCVTFLVINSSRWVRSEAVDHLIEETMYKNKIPGLALMILWDNEIIKAKGYGLSNIELNVPVTPKTVFQSGSIGKQFTATAIMMLVERGTIDLNDKIGRYLKNIPAKWNRITIAQLLSHTSGIPNYTHQKLNYECNYTEEELLKIVTKLPLKFAPGTNWEYSNTGYVLLGIIINKVTGEFYGNFLKKYIFLPIGMDATRIISETDIVPNRAAGYTLVNGELKNYEYISPSMNMTADGSLYFNMLDLAKWDAALYTEMLLKQSSLNQMWTIASLNNGQPNSGKYGFGWFIHNRNGYRILEHKGSWQGFSSMISRYPEEKFTIIIMTNLDNTYSDIETIMRSIVALYEPSLVSRE